MPLQPNSVERLAYDSTSITHAMRCHKFSFLEDSVKYYANKPKEQLMFDFGSAFHFILQTYLENGEQAARNYLEGSGKDQERQKEINAFEARDNKRNLRSLRLMFSKWLVDEKQTYKFITYDYDKPMIEYRLGFQISVEGMHYMFCGYLDRVVDFDGKMVPLDFKTTAKPKIQDAMSSFQNVLAADMYIKGLQINFGIEKVKRTFIFHIIGLPQSNSSVDSFVETISVEQDRLDLALINVKKIIARQGRYARAYDKTKKIEEFPMNHASCFSCKYSSFCRKSLTEQNRAIQSHMETDYTKKLWNPTLER